MRTGERMKVLSEFEKEFCEEIDNRKDELESQRSMAKIKQNYITMMSLAIQISQLDLCKMIFDKIYMEEFTKTMNSLIDD